MNMLEAKVEGLALDMTTNSPVVILAPLNLNKVLPIWIGHAEAWGIAMELSGVLPKRPMTYDLMKSMVDSLDGVVEKIEITELREQTFYARIYVNKGDKTIEIDARPSDSIAVALKFQARIFVNEDLLKQEKPTAEKAERVDEEPSQPEPMSTDPETLRERLKKINPEDFGKYSL